jgi:IMP and pyridine-specific 5'-nucleotidase
MWLDNIHVLISSSSDLMSHDTKIGIVTAAGYTEAERYYGRLHGLLEAIKVSEILTPAQKRNLVVMGKSSFPFSNPGN